MILSGGDPLHLPPTKIAGIIDRLRPDVPLIRIHSRAPITFPSVVTDELVQILSGRAPLWFVVHANHVDELSEEVVTGLARMVDAGIPVLNQSVLLRGVNDNVAALVDLVERLVEITQIKGDTEEHSFEGTIGVDGREQRLTMRRGRERTGRRAATHPRNGRSAGGDGTLDREGLGDRR